MPNIHPSDISVEPLPLRLLGLNEVAIEAMARGAGLTGRTVRQRDLHDIAGTWREDRAHAAHEAIEAEL